jgi:ATP-binding cassette, subfamily F, member 3
MIQATQLSKAYGEQTLFKDIGFNLSKGERVGLVGRNGSGKTTLFKIILGEESTDSGELVFPKNYRIGSLKQHLHFTEETIVKECSLALSKEAQFEQFRVEKILLDLGFQKDDFEKSPNDFSGGYQIRLNLAKLLLSEPDCLLLDEPTNYLDIISLRWLVKFLRQFQGEVILITHDRGFMDEVTTHTMGIWREKLIKVPGGTEKYYAQVRLEDEIYEKTLANTEKRKKELQDFVDRFRAKATKAAQAQSRVKLLEKLPQMEALANAATLDFEFNHRECPGKTLVDVKNVSFGYSEENLFEKLSFSIGRNDKIGIIGKNGKGKSTLLNVLAGEIEPRGGDIQRNVNLLLGHFGQTNINRLNLEATIEEEIASADPLLPLQRVRSICGVMMFGGELAKKKIKVLSGGERARVLLGKLLVKPTNLLLLDEPTNHLDLESVDALTLELLNYPGAVIIVTHSEGLLRDVVSKLIVFSKGETQYFPHGYEDFLEKIGWEEDEIPKQKQAGKSNYAENKKLRAEIIQERSKIISPLKKKMEKLERRIIELEAEEKGLEDKMLALVTSGDSGEIQKASQRLGLVKKEIESSFEELTEITLEHDEKFADFEKRLQEVSN